MRYILSSNFLKNGKENDDYLLSFQRIKGEQHGLDSCVAGRHGLL